MQGCAQPFLNLSPGEPNSSRVQTAREVEPRAHYSHEAKAEGTQRAGGRRWHLKESWKGTSRVRDTHRSMEESPGAGEPAASLPSLQLPDV